MPKALKRLGQHADESAIEYLRRAVGWVDGETETLLESLPNPEAVLDFFDLWSVYGTDFWSGILEGISQGDDPKPARNFVKKYRLPKAWSDDVRDAVAFRKRELAAA
jgi:hypothetical protein